MLSPHLLEVPRAGYGMHRQALRGAGIAELPASFGLALEMGARLEGPDGSCPPHATRGVDGGRA
jgi:hypothetical protein